MKYTITAKQIAALVQLNEDTVTGRFKMQCFTFYGVKLRVLRDQEKRGSPYRVHEEDYERLKARLLSMVR